MKKIILVSLLLVAHAAFSQQGNNQAVGVYTAAVKQMEIADRLEALGSLRGNESVSLASTVTELVTKVNFEDGQRVSKGDLLVQLDSAEELALKAEEQARYERAQQQVARFKPLAGRGAASEAALDDARSEFRTAEARLQAIEARLAQRKVVAPFDGVVGLRNVSVGALTQPGLTITTIDDDAVMRLDFAVPEVFLGSLARGNKITATTSAYPGVNYHGVVESIDSRIDQVTRSITVRARIPNKDFSLKPGLLMRVTLERNPRQALVIQEEAVIPNGNQTFVFVAKPDGSGYKAERREIRLGLRRQGEIEVLAGLDQGELVITHGAIKVGHGSPITVLAQEKDNETLSELLQTPSSSENDEAKNSSPVPNTTSQVAS